jgi:hypothetical protein
MKTKSLTIILAAITLISLLVSFKTTSDQNTVIVRFYEAGEATTYTASQIIIQDNEPKIIELKRYPNNPYKAQEPTQENFSALRQVLLTYSNNGYKITSTSSVSGYNYLMITTYILTK